MLYSVLLSIIIVSLIFFVLPSFTNGRKRKKQLQQLRKDWGTSIEAYRDFNWIRKFSQLRKETGFHTLSQQTLDDLDFDELFCSLDRTTSKPGQQYLYHQLLHPTNDLQQLQEFNELVLYFQQHAAERELIQMQLLHLADPVAHYITNLLSDGFYVKPRWAFLLKLDTALVILMILLGFQFHVLFVWLLLPFGVNVILHLWNKQQAYQFVLSLPQLNRLINTAKCINQKLTPRTSVSQSVKALKKFQNRFQLLDFNSRSIQGDISQLMGLFIMETLKGLFLIEVHSFMGCMDLLTSKREDIIALFEYVGSIDAAISTASLRTAYPAHCKPEFIPTAMSFSCRDIYHPLIEDCVTNSLVIDGKSILITGSNMSGKTTFIRTIAINSILAQTLFTCFASEFTTPFLKQFSSIRINDHLTEGNSYFFEEVKAIDVFIKATATPFQHLFILDELFKGTNTLERVAAAKAVLEYINQGMHIVLVSTHDLELSELLNSSYDLYHFEEQIIDDQLSFDHQLKKGKLTTTNAIKLLEISGYPKSIIEEANKLINASVTGAF